jgi:3-methyl-2-oxobutanoate hydroxymethyltransferase
MATMEMMVLHTQSVARGIGEQFIVADMPFMAHRGSLQNACDNATRLIQSGAHAIKIEGADPTTLEVISYLVASSIPVMGHIGLQPQSILSLGEYKVQGRQESAKKHLLKEAQALQQAGCFSIVLECIPENLATNITQKITIPTIGIGAGRFTDGQVLVWHDLLGFQNHLLPKFVKQYHRAESSMVDALQQYHQDVTQGHFPEDIHCYAK